MLKTKRSNCHLEAWREYRAGRAVGFCFLPTKYSKLERVVTHPLAFPVRLLGALLQWMSWPLTHLGEILRSGKWYHVHWVDKDGQHWEFVMTSDDEEYDARTRAFAPPLIFRGIVRRVSND